MSKEVIISKDELFTYDPTSGKRYKAIASTRGDGCRGCNVRQGGRLCLKFPCSAFSEFKPIRKDGAEKIWVRHIPEVHK